MSVCDAGRYTEADPLDEVSVNVHLCRRTITNQSAYPGFLSSPFLEACWRVHIYPTTASG